MFCFYKSLYSYYFVTIENELSMVTYCRLFTVQLQFDGGNRTEILLETLIIDRYLISYCVLGSVTIT